MKAMLSKKALLSMVVLLFCHPVRVQDYLCSIEDFGTMVPNELKTKAREKPVLIRLFTTKIISSV